MTNSSTAYALVACSVSPVAVRPSRASDSARPGVVAITAHFAPTRALDAWGSTWVDMAIESVRARA